MDEASHAGVCCRIHAIAAALLIGSGLSACDSPHAWDAVQIDTSQVDDIGGGVAAWHAGQDRFAAWTGRDQTRVRRVIFKDSICNGRCKGVYLSNSHTIRLVPTDPAWISLHELCHSLDHEEGWISRDYADILEPYGEELPRDLYPTENKRVGEVFARMCQQGPTQLEMVLTLNQACGTPGPVDAATIVGEIAFPDFGVALPTDRVTLRSFQRSLGEDASGVVGTAVQAVQAPWGLLVLYARETQDRRSGAYTVWPELLAVDTQSGTITDRLELPGHPPARVNGNPSTLVRSLVGSDTGPLVVKKDGRAWRVDNDPLRLEEIAWPDALGQTLPVGGFISGSTGLVLPRYGGEVQRVDLDSGEVEAVPATAEDTGGAEGEGFDPSVAYALQVDADGGVAVYPGTGGLALAGLDPTGEVTWSRTLPLTADILQSLFRLPDGRVVVTVEMSAAVTTSGGGALTPLSLVYDPTADTWAFVNGTCGALAGQDWLSTDAGAVRVTTTTSDDGRTGLALAWLTEE